MMRARYTHSMSCMYTSHVNLNSMVTTFKRKEKCICYFFSIDMTKKECAKSCGIVDATLQCNFISEIPAISQWSFSFFFLFALLCVDEVHHLFDSVSIEKWKSTYVKMCFSSFLFIIVVVVFVVQLLCFKSQTSPE